MSKLTAHMGSARDMGRRFSAAFERATAGENFEEPLDRLGGFARPRISPDAGKKSPRSAQQHGSSSGDESFEKPHSLPPILPTNTGANVLRR